MIFNILDNTTELWMTKYIISEIFSSGGATLYKNSSDQTVMTTHTQIIHCTIFPFLAYCGFQRKQKKINVLFLNVVCVHIYKMTSGIKLELRGAGEIYDWKKHSCQLIITRSKRVCNNLAIATEIFL